MSVKTTVIWSVKTDLVKIATEAYNRRNLQTQPEEVSIDPVTHDMTVTRFWVDQQSAQDWLDYINPSGPLSVILLDQ